MDIDSKIMIGERLKKVLYDNGFDSTKETLVYELDFNPSTLQKYLNNSRRPILEDIVKIARYFNVSVDYLISNTEFALDTWDHDYLKEFTHYASQEIQDHFTNRYNVNLPNNEYLSNMLFGLIELRFQDEFQRSLEELTDQDKKERLKKYQLISSIILNTIELAIKTIDNNEELDALNTKIYEALNEKYSFSNDLNLDELEGKAKTKEEKIKLLKTYIGLNMSNNQKALNLLEELSD